jgi:phosphatidylglycerophosphatase A
MKERIAFTLATWFGAGRSPWAPGTAGSIATLPLYWLLKLAPFGGIPVATAAVCAIGVWAAQVVSDRLETEDPQIVVIDEVAGVLIALLIAAPTSIWFELLAVAMFRLFDIWKPWPIRPLEKLRPSGVGIMMDDIAAGAVAGLIVLAIAHLPVFSNG